MQPMEIQKQKLSFFSGKKKFLVQPKEIVRLEAISNYTRVYFTDHQPVVMAKVLRAYDKLLFQYGFIRPHHSHLVNLRYVDSLDEKGIVHMRDTSSVETSRRKRSHFRRNLKNHISSHPIPETPML